MWRSGSSTQQQAVLRVQLDCACGKWAAAVRHGKASGKQHPTAGCAWRAALMACVLREVGSGSAAWQGLLTSCSKAGKPPVTARLLQAAVHLGSRRAA